MHTKKQKVIHQIVIVISQPTENHGRVSEHIIITRSQAVARIA